MKRPGFSATSLIFLLAFLVLLLGFGYFAVRAAGRNAERTFKTVPIEKFESKDPPEKN